MSRETDKSRARKPVAHTSRTHARCIPGRLAQACPSQPLSSLTPRRTHTRLAPTQVACTLFTHTHPSRTRTHRACALLHPSRSCNLLCTLRLRKPIPAACPSHSLHRSHARHSHSQRARRPVTRTPAAYARPSPPARELDPPPASTFRKHDATLGSLRVRQAESWVVVEGANRRGHSPALSSASSSDYCTWAVPLSSHLRFS
ncbi:hypothetical protein K438DRAFT_1977057 [Mycena galopus ATCC 62051]|nr:hypothetical protein K438DRAFT_1977057 [Mycena galopus ATCC 62051]